MVSEADKIRELQGRPTEEKTARQQDPQYKMVKEGLDK